MLSRYFKIFIVAVMLIPFFAMPVFAATNSNTNELAPGVLPHNSGLPGSNGQVDLPTYIGNIIKWAIGLIGIILLVMFVYGGLVLATSLGNEERSATGKRAIISSIVGIAIVAASYLLSDYILKALFAK